MPLRAHWETSRGTLGLASGVFCPPVTFVSPSQHQPLCDCHGHDHCPRVPQRPGPAAHDQETQTVWQTQKPPHLRSLKPPISIWTLLLRVLSARSSPRTQREVGTAVWRVLLLWRKTTCGIRSLRVVWNKGASVLFRFCVRRAVAVSVGKLSVFISPELAALPGVSEHLPQSSPAARLPVCAEEKAPGGISDHVRSQLASGAGRTSPGGTVNPCQVSELVLPVVRTTRHSLERPSGCVVQVYRGFWRDTRLQLFVIFLQDTTCILVLFLGSS